MAMDLQDWSLHSPQQVIDAVDVVLDMELGGSFVSQHRPTLGPTCQMRFDVSSSIPILSGSDLLCTWY